MIGIFGGTFDPVHFGHLRPVWEVRERLGVRDMRLLPAGQPPLRDNAVTPAHHRVEMLRLATAALPGLGIDLREVQRPGPSWMVDTLQEIRSEAGDRPVVLIVGRDSAASLDQWHQWERLIELAHIAVMRRPGAVSELSAELAEFYATHTVTDVGALAACSHGRVCEIEVTQLEISSSRIRELVRLGRSPRFLAPGAVVDYISEHGLYR
ncbi:MAG: nicotinate-nucleotide adenylyltransferase [Lysobacterales bacterium]